MLLAALLWLNHVRRLQQRVDTAKEKPVGTNALPFLTACKFAAAVCGRGGRLGTPSWYMEAGESHPQLAVAYEKQFGTLAIPIFWCGQFWTGR